MKQDLEFITLTFRPNNLATLRAFKREDGDFICLRWRPHFHPAVALVEDVVSHLNLMTNTFNESLGSYENLNLT